MAQLAPTPPTETDALIIGAGPVGLYQAFQLGLQEVHTHVVDALPHAGGQCVELYPDKPIYDIPGIAVCSGQELTNNLLLQIRPFAPDFHFGRIVTGLQKQADGRFLVETSGVSADRTSTPGAHGPTFLAKVVFIAAGVGAFQPRTLPVEGLNAFAGYQLHYAPTAPSRYAADHVVIVGDTDLALEAALRICPHPDNPTAQQAGRVTVLHRRDVFNAAHDTVAAFRARVESGHIQFMAGQVCGYQAPNGSLQALDILQPSGETTPLALDQVWVLQGLSPKLGPIASWGLDLERRQLVVNTETFGTSEPGIFAVGDINAYPGKKKLIVCGFHECVLAAFAAMPFISGEKKVLLQYTTTSSKLHRLLGVVHPGSE